MVGKLVGFKNVSFTDEKSGQLISGKRLYITYEDVSDGMTGVGCDYKYFPDNGNIKLPELVLNHSYDFIYQEQGLSGKAALVAVKKVN